MCACSYTWGYDAAAGRTVEVRIPCRGCLDNPRPEPPVLMQPEPPVLVRMDGI